MSPVIENPATAGRTPNIRGKPVRFHECRILNLDSGFRHKGLCDGPTFTPGTACAYGCQYCYVETMTYKNAAVRQMLTQENKEFSEVVIRRSDAVGTIRRELTNRFGAPKYSDPADTRVVFGSPLVDIAPTIELADETAEICRTILDLTHWRIRLLTKSPFITRIAEQIPENQRQRVIFGVSTGTLDDGLARAIETGTPLVRKRIDALHWLQDHGYRTFAMLCPSLPQDDYVNFSAELCEAVRVDRCEHVWAEVLNARGPALTRTCAALESAGYSKQASALRAVSEDKAAWEQYARSTFLAHTRHVPADKLRFLQYVTSATRLWWAERRHLGAVVLGRRATSTVA